MGEQSVDLELVLGPGRLSKAARRLAAPNPGVAVDSPEGEDLTEAATVPKEVWLVVAALDDKRAKDIVVLDLTKVSDSLDYFVLATAESTLQLRALQESVKERLKRGGAQPRGIEGPSERWVLIDYGSVVVHLMSPEAREFYDLEGLWIDAGAPRSRARLTSEPALQGDV